MTPNTPPDIALLVTTAWDLRAIVEAQLRRVTLLQRSIDDYRASGPREALDDVARHLDAIEASMPSLIETFPQARKALAAIQAGDLADTP